MTREQLTEKLEEREELLSYIKYAVNLLIDNKDGSIEHLLDLYIKLNHDKTIRKYNCSHLFKKRTDRSYGLPDLVECKICFREL